MTDFLITFTVDGTQAIRMMEEIGARAKALEAQLNNLGKGRTSAGSTSGFLAGLGLTPTQVKGASSALSGLEAQVAKFRQTSASAKQLNLQLSAGQFKTAAIAAQSLANQLGPTNARFTELTARAREWTAESQRMAAVTDDTTQSFARHTRRIFEAIIVYEAFGAAIRGLSSATELIIDIDRESRRLEAVLSIDPEQGARFITGLGDIASRTVTPIGHLVEEADRASSAFLDIEDPVQRAAASLELMEDAGKFTTVTQRDLGQEITNLIAIMQQLNIPIADFDDFLGKIVVAGGNASTVIGGLSDALQIVARSAEEAGTDTDVLLALLSEFIIKTGRTGSEVGNTFKTLFQRLSDPDVADNVSEITNGFLKMRDAAGNIRDPIQILLELNALLEEGVINTTQFKDVLGTLAPPLNPAARQDFILINDILQDIGPRVKEIANADVGNLDQLVEKINDALGPQFQKLIIDAQKAFVQLFGPAIIAGGQALIEILRDLGTILGALPPELITIVGVAGALAIAFKVLAFAGRGLITILGLGGLGSLFGSGAAGGTLAAGMAGTSRAATITAGALSALRLALSRIIPLAIAFAAIEIGSKLLKDAAAIQALKDAGIDEGTAKEAVNGTPFVGGNQLPTGRVNAPRGNIIPEGNLTDIQRENLLKLSEALIQFNDAGNLTVATENAMKKAILSATGEVSKHAIALDSIVAAGSAAVEASSGLASSTSEVRRGFTEMNAGLGESADGFSKAEAGARLYAEGLANVSRESQIAAESERLVASLAGDVDSSLDQLVGRLRDGEIGARGFAAGQDRIIKASELAAQVVAAASDELAKVPSLAYDAAQGNDALAKAIFNMIVSSTDQLPAIDAVIQKIIQLAGSAAGAAAIAAANPIIIRTFIAAPVNGGQIPGGFHEGTDEFGAPSGATTRSSTIINVAGIQADIARQIQALIGSLFRSISTGTNSQLGIGPSFSSGGGTSGGTTRERPRADTFDIGDLPRSMIPTLIAIATRLRNKIPGERAASRDELIALIKNARFLQTVKGIDDRLLRLALDKLTKQIERQNQLEEQKAQRNNFLRNLVVNAGPLSALVSQPTALGVGGNLALGRGLNFNPQAGNFVINVPVELKGLQPAALQRLIYNIIGKAIRDALRLG